MRFIADFHIHSRFSRATSKVLTPENLFLWSQRKGITILGTGDFTHPGWVDELRGKLQIAEDGLFRLRDGLHRDLLPLLPPSCRRMQRFILTGEISCVYKKGGRTRRVHHLVFMPGFDALDRFNKRLSGIGNLSADGRPILALDSRSLLEIALEASATAFVVPAHVWTPWFSVLGSKSGFDSIEECFEDLTGHIRALETGLSSDPPMNRLLSRLDRFQLISNSDAHSPSKIGREATLFQTEPDYPHLIEAMTHGQDLAGTIEFFPQEGKYHLDGHRKCRIRLEPEETRLHGGRCPVCGRPVTVGVLNRVRQLADRSRPRLTKPFFGLIPLTEILAEILGCQAGARKVALAYENLLRSLGPELVLLMETAPQELSAVGGPRLGEAVRRMRASQVSCTPGYDGEYGVVRLFGPLNA